MSSSTTSGMESMHTPMYQARTCTGSCSSEIFHSTMDLYRRKADGTPTSFSQPRIPQCTHRATQCAPTWGTSLPVLGQPRPISASDGSLLQTRMSSSIATTWLKAVTFGSTLLLLIPRQITEGLYISGGGAMPL